MFLDSNKKLVAVLTAAKTTLNLPVMVDYVDLTSTTTSIGQFPSYTNGTTAVDILTAPTSPAIRKINGLTIYGRDTAAKTVRIYTVDSTPTTGLITAGAFVAGNDYQIVSVGTTDFTLIGASANTVGVIFTATGVGTGTGTAATAYQIIDMTLQIDDTLIYTDTNGLKVLDVSGQTKMALPNYLPLVGGTLTGPLTGTSASFTSLDGVTIDSTTNKPLTAATGAALAGNSAQDFSVKNSLISGNAVLTGATPTVQLVNGNGNFYVVTGAVGGTFGFNRNPFTGAIPDATQSAAYINILGGAGASSIQFQTSPTVNTNPVLAFNIAATNVASQLPFISTTTIRTGGYTVATLPAGTQGDRAYVTDATAPTWNGALTGGGAVVVPVFRNATVWVSA